MDAVNIWKMEEEPRIVNMGSFLTGYYLLVSLKAFIPIAAQKEANKHQEVIAPAVRYIFLAFLDTSPHIGNMIL